jgi:hypothetical protein
VNWQHVRAFLWLRWRLTANHWRRGGAINGLLMMIVAVCAVALVVPLFVACFVGGLFLLPDARPVDLLYLWDGLVVVFLFFWGIGLMTELQRTESLSLSKFLHLPVSVASAFAINYVSSLLRLSLILFVPAMLAVALALVFTKGWLLLAVLPLLVAFLLMITAVTYQFQGWLAALMTNPRRRRNVVVAATALFVLVFQLPNLLNFMSPWQQRANQSQALSDELQKLQGEFQSGQFDAQEHVRRQNELMEQHKAASEEAARISSRRLAKTAAIVNLVLPLGWLPLGVMHVAEGKFVPALLGMLGMTLIGAASLWRSYVTTVRIYQGGFTRGRKIPAAKVANLVPLTKLAKPRANLLEARIPWLSEQISAVMLASLRSLLRAPEAKMMLLTPIMMAAIFGFMALQRFSDVPAIGRPWVAFGAMVLVLFGLLQLMANQFGFDRDGFRVFVLCAAPRRDILLGKNLSFLPAALALAAALLACVQVACPLRLDQLLAMPLLFLSMFLPFCVLANLLSIIAPMPIAAGSLKPASPKLAAVFLQLALFSTLFPLAVAPAIVPLGAESVLEGFGWTDGAPICLLLALGETAVIVLLYGLVLRWQGKLLQTREQKILETITGRSP